MLWVSAGLHEEAFFYLSSAAFTSIVNITIQLAPKVPACQFGICDIEVLDGNFPIYIYWCLTRYFPLESFSEKKENYEYSVSLFVIKAPLSINKVIG